MTGPVQPLGRAQLSDPSEHVSLYALLSVLVRRWRQFALASATVLLLVLAFVLVLGGYTAKSEFVPSAPASNLSKFAGIAAELGFSVGAASAGPTVDFYSDLIQSRGLLAGIAQTEYDVPHSNRATLLELYHSKGRTPEDVLNAAVRKLRGKIAVSKDVKAGTVTVETEGSSRELAEQVNRRVLDLVNEFNLHARQSLAGAERVFVEGRLHQAQQDLDSAEGDLSRFLQNNRRYQDSPTLSFEAARLQRRVDLRQQLYLSLSQAYEEARIAEVRNTPVITIVDAPEGSGEPRYRLLPAVAVGLALGCTFALALVFGVEYLDVQRRESPEVYSEFRTLRRAALGRFGGIMKR